MYSPSMALVSGQDTVQTTLRAENLYYLTSVSMISLFAHYNKKI
jgi:hypothetical protein